MTERERSNESASLQPIIAPPLPRTWWIEPGKILGGPFPGSADGTVNKEKLHTLFKFGIRVFVNLQQPHEKGGNARPFPDYEPELKKLAATENQTIRISRFSIPDTQIPTIEQMQAIQTFLREQLAADKKVFVHCWGGNGRTGTVAACWLADKGLSVRQALEAIKHQRAWDAYLAAKHSPENGVQVEFVRAWFNRRKN